MSISSWKTPSRAFFAAEQRFGRIFVSFAALAVIIACLGLVGLSSFTAERRRKEIGVRKVLGASIPNVFGMLSSEFVRLVIVANVRWPGRSHTPQ